MSLRQAPRHTLRASKALLVAATFALAGCTAFSPDGGFSPVEKAAKTQLGKDVAWARSDADRQVLQKRVAELMARPLSADDAVQVALLNHRGLQAAFFELGIAEADVVQAGRLVNPGFSFSRLKRGDEIERERGIHVNLARLLAMPMVRRLEQGRFEQAQRQATAQMLSLASETRKAYYRAVAAGETVRYKRQVLDAAEAGAELARRMAAVGNWNKRDQAREQSFHADAAVNLAHAALAQSGAREQLTRLLGAWGGQAAFQLPERLPELPPQAQDLPGVEQTAMQQRLDVQAAKATAQQTASSLGLTRTTRFVNVLELGAVSNTSNQAPTQRGYELSFELPLFDWGGARVAKAEAIYMQAMEQAAQTAIEARSEVRQAYLAYRSRYDMARHYRDEIVPLKKRISDENLLRYNGMLIGVFELLADARSQIGSVNGAIDALRDFWLAQADLDMALIGKPALGDLPAVGAGPAASDSAAAAH